MKYIILLLLIPLTYFSQKNEKIELKIYRSSIKQYYFEGFQIVKTSKKAKFIYQLDHDKKRKTLLADDEYNQIKSLINKLPKEFKPKITVGGHDGSTYFIKTDDIHVSFWEPEFKSKERDLVEFNELFKYINILKKKYF